MSTNATKLSCPHCAHCFIPKENCAKKCCGGKKSCQLAKCPNCTWMFQSMNHTRFAKFLDHIWK